MSPAVSHTPTHTEADLNAALASVPRIALVGPMGIGKTTAVRALCGEDMASSDVRNLDPQAHHKEFTTVGAEFGDIYLEDGERVQLCGCPGQERFDFVRQWVLSVSMGVFIMVDVNDPSAPEQACHLLGEVAATPTPPIALILGARPATPPQIEAFAAALSAAGHGVLPILEIDVRQRADMLGALGVLVSMLSLQHEEFA